MKFAPAALAAVLPLRRRFAVALPTIVGAALAWAVGCEKTDPTAFQPDVPAEAGEASAPEPEVGPDEVSFPENFLFGSATSAFQIETGNGHTDWAAWVALGRTKNGESPDVGGPDALAHVDEDIRALKASGQNAYRFSIEWGRIYPTLQSFSLDTPDTAALESYDTLLVKLRENGITPMVTLQHFSLPDYLANPAQSEFAQGWERPESVEMFAEFAGRMAARFQDKVDWWVTINEPMVVAVAGYIAGQHPPGVILQSQRAFTVVKTAARAHARAFDAIHHADTVDADGDGKAALVSIAAHQRTFHPRDPSKEADIDATERVRYLWNLWFLNAIVRGDWDDDLDGDYDGASDRRADPELVGRADYLGINYYSDTIIGRTGGIVIPIVNATVQQEHLPTERPKTDIGWDIHPDGLRTVLLEAKDYGLPVLVTENGLADGSDRNRPRYLTEHLYQVGWARELGVDLRGYFHWSLMDNFEWSLGYCPKFGLYGIDMDAGASEDAGTRRARPSAETYRAITEARRIRRADVEGMPAYTAPTRCP